MSKPTARTRNRTKRGWAFAPDLIETFDEWIEAVGMFRNTAAELAFWILMHASPAERQAQLTAMRRRKRTWSTAVRDGAGRPTGKADRK